jgi:hypothetical protein
MIMVKTHDVQRLRLAFALQTQVLDYFLFKLPPALKLKFKKYKEIVDDHIARIERLGGRRNAVMEAKALKLVISFGELIYLFKGNVGLGISFRKRMDEEDLLDNALGISKEDVTEIKDDLPLSEDEKEDFVEITNSIEKGEDMGIAPKTITHSDTTDLEKERLEEDGSDST